MAVDDADVCPIFGLGRDFVNAGSKYCASIATKNDGLRNHVESTVRPESSARFSRFMADANAADTFSSAP